MKPKRKKREVLAADPKLSLLDFPLTDIGSENDPCFGKLYDPRATECSRCGDSEFCAIALGQNNHLKRLEVETTQVFKDKEEDEIPKPEPKKLNLDIKRKVVKVIGLYGTKGVKHSTLKAQIYNEFFSFGATPNLIGKLIKRVVSKNQNITIKNEKYYDQRNLK